MNSIQAIQNQITKEIQGSVTIVVLGASGDLAKKKTIPALFRLFRNGFLPDNTHIAGYARSKMTHEEYLEGVTHYIKVTDQEVDLLERFKRLLTYQAGTYDQDESYQALNTYIKTQCESKMAPDQCNRVFYMALPPSVFVPAARGLRHNVYATDGFNRIVVEKPFGKDLASSAQLAKDLGQLFSEKEIWRIDHYLGKEMVKNVMMVRFANIFFSQIWNCMYIDNVQITFKEPFGCENRGYFDEYGIIRDVMQNHLLQILSLVAMERPISTDAEAIRDEKVKVLKCIPPIDIQDTLLGQYTSNGDKPGYLQQQQQHKTNLTPTFAALVLWIQNERWEGVPFIMKAGKALDCAKVEVRIQFRNVAGNLYKTAARNELVIRVQPDEALYMKFNNKSPGLSYQTIQTDLDLTYENRYTDLAIPEAYESLLLDVLRNDHSNFVRDDELEAAWQIFTPLLHKMDRHDADINMTEYKYGSRGPDALDAFVRKYGYDRSNAHYDWPLQSVSVKKN